jgi:cyanophycinase-like exopeptidase
MNKEKRFYLFAGGRGRTIFSTFSEIRNIIRGSANSRPVIAFVGVASLNDNWLIYAICSLLIKWRCQCQLKRVIIAPPKADLDKARAILKTADIIFMSGGDVEAGMRILDKTKMASIFHELADDGKIFIGVSAGTIMLSREWVRWKIPNDDSSAELFTCLGLVDVVCDTHCEADNWKELRTALRLTGQGAIGYGIKSGACLLIKDNGQMEIRGEIETLQHLHGRDN